MTDEELKRLGKLKPGTCKAIKYTRWYNWLDSPIDISDIRAYNILMKAGYKTNRDVKYNLHEIKNLKGCGEETYRIINNYVKRHWLEVFHPNYKEQKTIYVIYWSDYGIVGHSFSDKKAAIRYVKLLCSEIYGCDEIHHDKDTDTYRPQNLIGDGSRYFVIAETILR